MALPTVALVGATGRAGQHIANALLTNRHNFKDVVLLARKTSTSSYDLDKWNQEGAIIRMYDNNILQSLDGVQILINA